MILTAISLFEWWKGKFSWTRRTSCLESRNNRFWAKYAEISLTAITFFESARWKFFMKTTYIYLQSRNPTFLGSAGKNESNSHNLVRIGHIKIFHWREENFSWTRRTSCLQNRNQTFLGSGAEMSLIAISLFESARGKFFMNMTQNMCKNMESNVFELSRPKWV